jgi:hypothetical protein
MKKNTTIFLLLFLFFSCKKEEYIDTLGYTETGAPPDFQERYLGIYNVECKFQGKSSIYYDISHVTISIDKTNYRGMLRLSNLYSRDYDERGASALIIIAENGEIKIPDFKDKASDRYTNGSGLVLSNGKISYQYEVSRYNCNCEGYQTVSFY